MAAKSNRGKAGTEASASQPGLVLALLILAVIGGGAGAGFAVVFLQAKPEVAAPATATLTEKRVENDNPQTSRFPADAVEVALDPIVTSIGPNDKPKMRLEASMIVNKNGASSQVLKKEVAEDIIAFLKSVTMADISGSRGFQNLREDLDDRARIRGRGMVFGLLISGFVFE